MRVTVGMLPSPISRPNARGRSPRKWSMRAARAHRKSLGRRRYIRQQCRRVQCRHRGGYAACGLALDAGYQSDRRGAWQPYGVAALARQPRTSDQYRLVCGHCECAGYGGVQCRQGRRTVAVGNHSRRGIRQRRRRDRGLPGFLCHQSAGFVSWHPRSPAYDRRQAHAARQGQFLVISHRSARWQYRLRRLSPERFFNAVLKATRSFIR